MPDARRFLTALRRVIRPSPARGAGPSPVSTARADAAPGPVATDLEASPGRFGPAATVELDPARVRRVRFSYAPEHDGEPDPGEVVWTWVPYEERDGRGKDRPVVVVAAGEDDRFLAVPLTSRPQDGDPDAVALGSGAWDGDGRPSWARIDRVFRIHADGMRREAASLDAARYRRVVEALEARYGWG
ncbi:type II toxin-antitoxin system PemK/MazF family toxin [Agromyces tropicus]|uniref:Type II toxin-antitoxin system PemK/MazF family toxin n=1 Tax=Agromyces tropicus TaxID=555371 RepID=A0ABP5FDV5_9MICO